MKKKRKFKAPFKPSKVNYNKRDIFALIFGLVAVSFFILNAVYFLTEKDTIFETLISAGFSQFYELFLVLSFVLPIVWLIFSILMAIVIHQIEHKRLKWYSLLILSILSFFTLRIDSCILGIISSILYLKNHN